MHMFGWLNIVIESPWTKAKVELPHLCRIYSSYSLCSSNSSSGCCSQLSPHTPHEFKTRSDSKAYQFQDNQKEGKKRKIEHRFPNPLIKKWSATSVSTNRIASIQIRTRQKKETDRLEEAMRQEAKSNICVANLGLRRAGRPPVASPWAMPRRSPTPWAPSAWSSRPPAWPSSSTSSESPTS